MCTYLVIYVATDVLIKSLSNFLCYVIQYIFKFYIMPHSHVEMYGSCGMK